MGVRHERANGERARKRDGARALWSPPPCYRYRVYSPPQSTKMAHAALPRVHPSSASHDAHRTRGHVPQRREETDPLDVTSAPVRRIGTVTEFCQKEIRASHVPDADAMRATQRPTRRRDETVAPKAATLTALAKKPSDGKLLPMRYISSSSASMHLRCRLMTSRKKA